MHVEFESKHHHIVATGSVISFNDDPLILKMPLEGEDLSFVFTFGHDVENPEKPSLKAIPHGDRKLELQFLNFDYQLGTGNVSPIEVGTIDGQSLYLNYRVYVLDNSDCRLIHYTLYQDK